MSRKTSSAMKVAAVFVYVAAQHLSHIIDVVYFPDSMPSSLGWRAHGNGRRSGFTERSFAFTERTARFS